MGGVGVFSIGVGWVVNRGVVVKVPGRGPAGICHFWWNIVFFRGHCTYKFGAWRPNAKPLETVPPKPCKVQWRPHEAESILQEPGKDQTAVDSLSHLLLSFLVEVVSGGVLLFLIYFLDPWSLLLHVASSSVSSAGCKTNLRGDTGPGDTVRNHLAVGLLFFQKQNGSCCTISAFLVHTCDYMHFVESHVSV